MADLSIDSSLRVAVVGSGMAGASCAQALVACGFDVTVFDKSRGIGGRMATRRVEWVDAQGLPHEASFDHGAPWFTATQRRFQALLERAGRSGHVQRWRQRVYASFPGWPTREVIVPTPGMPALCRHLLEGATLRLGVAVTRLQREADGWHLALAEGKPAGPFDRVIVAIPAAQAALLVAGHRDDWADAFGEIRMAPCWTLMAVTDDLDWDWDAAEPDRGPLALVIRNDRKPGRGDAGGSAQWVAHATSAWSTAHLEDEPASVRAVLTEALEKLLPGGSARHWHHLGAHRWRYANLLQTTTRGPACGWDGGLGLGVCGDAFGNGTVEAAWRSGDEMADAVAAPSPVVTPAPVQRHREVH
jgi:renalase